MSLDELFRGIGWAAVIFVATAIGAWVFDKVFGRFRPRPPDDDHYHDMVTW